MSESKSFKTQNKLPLLLGIQTNPGLKTNTLGYEMCTVQAINSEYWLLRMYLPQVLGNESPDDWLGKAF